jgi:hypothetical protein
MLPGQMFRRGDMPRFALPLFYNWNDKDIKAKDEEEGPSGSMS